jgi:hypothetical protein
VSGPWRIRRKRRRFTTKKRRKEDERRRIDKEEESIEKKNRNWRGEIDIEGESNRLSNKPKEFFVRLR